MRVLLFLVIILVAGYSLMDLLGILSKEREINPLKEKVGIERVKIPKKLEKEYIQMAKMEKKLYLKHKDTKENMIIIKKDDFHFTQNKDFPLKIKDKRTIKDNLYIDVFVKNRTKDKYQGKLFLLCKTYNANKKEQDIFTWSQKITINPDKVILLKKVKLGYINVENTKHIRCKVDKFKKY